MSRSDIVEQLDADSAVKFESNSAEGLFFDFDGEDEEGTEADSGSEGEVLSTTCSVFCAVEVLLAANGVIGCCC